MVCIFAQDDHDHDNKAHESTKKLLYYKVVVEGPSVYSYRTYHLDSMSSIPGGNSAAKVPSGPDDEIYAIFTDAIKQELSLVEVNVHSCGSTHSLLCHTPLSTNNGVEIHRTDTTQVVAGTRYQIKIRVEDGSFWHFSVIKPLPHTGDPPFIQPG